jgi:hypothetical protein
LAATQGNDRFSGGHGPGDAAEAFVILDRLDIKQGGADFRLLAQPSEIVLDPQVHRIADRHHGGERQVAGVSLVDELLGQRSRLRNESKAIAGAGRRAGRQVAQEGGGESPGLVEMDDAGAIGPLGPASAKPPGRIRRLRVG